MQESIGSGALDGVRHVAVLGAATPVGAAVVDALDRGAGAQTAVLALDVDGLPLAPPTVTVRRIDARDRLLALALDGVEEIVHCAFADDISAGADATYGHNVGSTRNVLEAASKVGVRRLVVLSSVSAYGAHPDNPVPLDEDAPLRANPGFAYAYQRQLVENLVREWAAEHPAAEVTILRTAPLVGPGVDNAAVQRLLAPRIPAPSDAAAPVQLAHVDDVAAAVVAVLAAEAPGVRALNVASDGWLGLDEAASLLGRSVQRIPTATLEQLLESGRRAGLPLPPPDAVAFIRHPCVLDVRRLRALGWSPTHTNRELLQDLARAHESLVVLGPLRVERARIRRSALLGALGVGFLASRIRRRWRRARRRSS